MQGPTHTPFLRFRRDSSFRRVAGDLSFTEHCKQRARTGPKSGHFWQVSCFSAKAQNLFVFGLFRWNKKNRISKMHVLRARFAPIAIGVGNLCASKRKACCSESGAIAFSLSLFLTPHLSLPALYRVIQCKREREAVLPVTITTPFLTKGVERSARVKVATDTQRHPVGDQD